MCIFWEFSFLCVRQTVDESRELMVFEMGSREPESLTCKVIVKPLYTTPAVGIEFDPMVRVQGITSFTPPQHDIKFSWFVSSTSFDHHFSLFGLFF